MCSSVNWGVGEAFLETLEWERLLTQRGNLFSVLALKLDFKPGASSSFL
jgi:hypothetical protein